MNRTLVQSTRVKLNRGHHEWYSFLWMATNCVFTGLQGAVIKGYQWKTAIVDATPCTFCYVIRQSNQLCAWTSYVYCSYRRAALVLNIFRYLRAYMVPEIGQMCNCAPILGRGGRVVQGVWLVTERSPDQLLSATKFITLHYWAKLYALAHFQANSA